MECFKELIVGCEYNTLMELIGKEGGWALFEDEKTFPDGVVVIARYVVFKRGSPGESTFYGSFTLRIDSFLGFAGSNYGDLEEIIFCV